MDEPASSLPPGTQWLRDIVRSANMKRDNPEDMFTPEETFARNKQFAKPGPYETKLQPQEEQAFRQWVQQNNINWTPDDKSYDMRGFWKAMQQGDPRAVSSPNPDDIDPKTKQPRMHFPDVWKTPYEATFSNQSMYALPSAPSWEQTGQRWQYMRPGGQVIYDDATGIWNGVR